MSDRQRPGYCAVSLDCDTMAEDFHPLTGKQDCYPIPRSWSLRTLLPRVLEWLRKEEVRATLFVIGRDLEESAGETFWKAALRDGHEIGNHTYTHPQNFSTLPPRGIRGEIERGHAAITGHLGRTPEGFRAPGYTITPEIVSVLAGLGYRYDSSLNPSPSYIAAKRLYRRLLPNKSTLSRQSVDILSLPRDAFDFSDLPSGAWRREGSFLEFPINIVPLLTVPFVTSLMHSWRSPFLSPLFGRVCARYRVVNLELHLIEFLDAGDLPHPTTFLARSILRRPLARRLAAFSRLLSTARRRGMAMGPLRDAPPSHA